MKQWKLVNEVLVTWKNHEQNRVFKLIKKILLFQYSEEIFSAHDRDVTLTLTHNIHLISLFVTSRKLSLNSFFSERYKRTNIETKEIG